MLNVSMVIGPTILFKRICDGKEQKFYACSACRDKKDCNFYWKFEDEWTEKKQAIWEIKRQHTLPKINHNDLNER